MQTLFAVLVLEVAPLVALRVLLELVLLLVVLVLVLLVLLERRVHPHLPESVPVQLVHVLLVEEEW